MKDNITLGSDVSKQVNIDGVLKVKVVKKYSDSMVSKILDLVENANVNKGKTEKFITKFAKYYTPSNLAMLLNFMKEESLFCNLGIIPSRCRDPKDDYLLELALCSEADYLITGDKDLLTIQKIGTCQIVTAMEFEMLAASMGHTSMLHEAESEYCDISLLIDKTPNI